MINFVTASVTFWNISYFPYNASNILNPILSSLIPNSSPSILIFSLLNQLENELATVYDTYNVTTTDENSKKVTREIRLTGVEALNEWTRKFRRDKQILPESFRFGHFYQSSQILLIVHSFQLIQSRLEVATIREDVRGLFRQKLRSFYECRLYYPLKKIHEALSF